MEVAQRYELLELTRRGPVETWSARDRSTGCDVSVHRLTGARGAHATLLQRLDRLPEWAAGEISDSGESGGMRFFVTAPWLRAESFEEWVIGTGRPNIREDEFAKAGTWRIPTVEFGRRCASSEKEPGEFTRMFQTVSPEAAPSRPEPLPTPSPAPHPEPEEPQPGTPVSPPGLFTSMYEVDRARQAQQSSPPASGGEFTRLFRAAPPLPGEEVPTAEIPIPGVAEKVAEEPASPPAEPGAFTRMFHVEHSTHPRPPEAQPSAAGSPLPAVQPPDSSAGQPGEFTRMFRASGPNTPAPARPVPARAEEPGEFTRKFGPLMPKPPGPPSAVQPPPAAEPVPHAAPPVPLNTGPGEFTRMFQTSRPAAPAPPPVIQPPPSAQEAPAAQQPGEFTRMFRTSRPAPPVPEAPSGIQKALPVQEPGEFTRMFQAAPAPSSQIQKAPPLEKGAGPGEFTRMFESVPPPARQPAKDAGHADPMQQPTPGDFDKLFNAPPAASTPAAHPAFRNPFGSQRTPATQQPGEPDGFTKMFGAQPASPAGSPQIPSSSQAAPPPPVMGTYTAMFSVPGAAAPQAPAQAPAAQQGSPQQPGGEFTRAFPLGGAAEPPQSVLVKPPGKSAPKGSPRKTAARTNLVPLYVILGVLVTALVILICVLAFR